MSDESNESREQGIGFGDLMPSIERLDYPVTNDRLLETHGDEELQIDDRTVTLGEALGDRDDVSYEDPNSIKQAVFNMIGDGAVGRKGYTDRGGNPSETAPDTDAESF